MNIADINLEVRELCNANASQYTDANLLRRVNAAYEDIIGKLIALDDRWVFGDTNYSTLPTGTQNLVDGQQTYTFDATQLNILRVEVKDNSGIWHPIDRISLDDIPLAQPEYYKTSGYPIQYEARENFLLLYPPPAAASVTTTLGLKVYFQRTASTFTSGEVTTGTKSPGFASPFHYLLAYKAALPYAIEKQLPQKNDLQAMITKGERELLAFYAERSKDEDHKLTMGRIRFR